MKTLLKIATCLLVFSQTTFAQNLVSARTANLVTGDYTTQGTVHLESFDDGTLDLRFESDYMTQANVFDVHVFLSNSNNYNAPIDTTGMLLVENIGSISGLNYSSGAMTFDLPNGTGINDYQYIVLVCVQFGRLHWADGTFGAAMTANVDELSQAPTFSLYPNPTNGDVQVSGNLDNKSVRIASLNGAVISEQTTSGTLTTLPTGTLDGGIYLVQITDLETRQSTILRFEKHN